MSTKVNMLVLTAVAAGSLSFAPAAFASSGADGEVIRTGACTQNSDWKLKAKPDDGRLEVEFEVDSNVVGQTWQVVIKDNGTKVFSGKRQTVAPSGSFDVERRIANQAGADHIVAKATNAATGEVCRGALTI
jgi:hypothetical protein